VKRLREDLLQETSRVSKINKDEQSKDKYPDELELILFWISEISGKRYLSPKSIQRK